jgi:hypothetical protein
VTARTENKKPPTNSWENVALVRACLDLAHSAQKNSFAFGSFGGLLKFNDMCLFTCGCYSRDLILFSSGGATFLMKRKTAGNKIWFSSRDKNKKPTIIDGASENAPYF